MFAPDSTNLIAPVSTRSRFIISGYLCSRRSVGSHGSSRAAKKSGSSPRITSCTWSGLRRKRHHASRTLQSAWLCVRRLRRKSRAHHLPIMTCSFFGRMMSMTPDSSSHGYESSTLAAFEPAHSQVLWYERYDAPKAG